MLQLPQIPRSKPTFKRLRISRQTRRNSITLQRIQNRLIFLILRRINMKGRKQPNKRSVEFSISEMRACTHARSGSVGVVRCSRAFWVLEIAFYDEGFGVFEVC
jgi:hypothetical protein